MRDAAGCQTTGCAANPPSSKPQGPNKFQRSMAKQRVALRAGQPTGWNAGAGAPGRADRRWVYSACLCVGLKRWSSSSAAALSTATAAPNSNSAATCSSRVGSGWTRFTTPQAPGQSAGRADQKNALLPRAPPRHPHPGRALHLAGESHQTGAQRRWPPQTRPPTQSDRAHRRPLLQTPNRNARHLQTLHLATA